MMKYLMISPDKREIYIHKAVAFDVNTPYIKDTKISGYIKKT